MRCMVSEYKLKEKYVLAGCCEPKVGDRIVGYISHDDCVKVHYSDCGNLAKADPDRLVQLDWQNILADKAFEPDGDYQLLDSTDFAVLRHHRKCGIDYSLMVAKVLGISRQEAFDRHRKLRELKLIERIPAVMVRYREKTVKHKWIKHRNHTYYHLTEKGSSYLDCRYSTDE